MRHYVEQQKLTPEHYKLQVKIHHNGTGTNAWTSSPQLPLTDWMENRDRTRQWLDQLANELNSSQNMDVSRDNFFTDLTFVRTPSNGGQFKKYNIKSMSFQDMLRKKQSIITIHNRDELCCARAIVTLKARIEGDSHYPNVRKGRPIQTRLAQQLHRDAQVPELACGTAELDAFQEVLGHDYQIIVLEGIKGHIIYKNKLNL